MEPRKDNVSDIEAFENTYPPLKVSSPTVQWSENYHCYTVNGLEAAIPITAVQGGNEESAEPRGKKRNKPDKKFSFKLFKFPNMEEQYLVEIHDEINAGVIDRYRVFTHEKKGKWNVGVQDLVPGNHVVKPILHDPTTPIFHKKYDIPLEDRLLEWSREKRARSNGKEDKFYYHRDERQFRSFVEMITFVIYSCKVNDLVKVNSTNSVPQEVPEVEAMVTITSLNSAKNSFRRN